MSYHFSKRLDVPFEQAVSRVSHRGAETRGLRGAYGYRCERNAESEAWRGLSSLQNPRACNPQLAHRALQFEDKIGAMLPCNVIMQQHAGGAVEVSAVDPIASMQAIENPRLAEVAKEVRAKLRHVVNAL